MLTAAGGPDFSGLPPSAAPLALAPPDEPVALKKKEKKNKAIFAVYANDGGEKHSNICNYV